ncbi:hypothetical protein T492DRAFT_844644 [Pavlovales sp. CCMP2436]|nr:hypothetical protein T492DRAFT_844644 [Pavlovales sp. CCMP2436]
MSEILGSGEIEKSGSKPPPDAKTLGGPDEEMEGASAQADAHGPSAMPPPDAKTLGWLYEWAMERNMSALTTALCTDLPDIDDRLRKDFSKDMRKREFLYAIQGLTLDDFTTHAMPRHLWAVRLLRELSFLDMDELGVSKTPISYKMSSSRRLKGEGLRRLMGELSFLDTKELEARIY